MNSSLIQDKIGNFLSFLKREYVNTSIVMYDVGARYGIHYLYTELVKHPNFSVIGFEPDEEEASKLNENNMSGIRQTFPLALAESEGVRTIYITKHPGCCSLYLPNTKFLSNYLISDLFEIVDTISVKTISLDQFIAKFEVSKPHYLKLDIQGAEYEVLNGGQSALKNNVIGIFLETYLQEIYIDSPLFFDIHNLLTSLGFKLISCQYNPSFGGEIMELDVAFVRDINFLNNEEDILKGVLFCLIHSNFEFAANIVRDSDIDEANKMAILEILDLPLHPQRMLVNSEDLYINSKIELRKIQEDWWK
ncbi:MAG: FkbM family methyltransferase [Nostoc sp.]|uniref:FkbM family methyltransferase n=1 Tax=Nostoc sp. TaxID=1180 RepID=UPI002FF85B82